MTDTTQNDLARERTHAAWLRTALAFLVATVALWHYRDTGIANQEFFLPVLTAGMGVSSYRAWVWAPDIPTVLTSISLLAMSVWLCGASVGFILA